MRFGPSRHFDLSVQVRRHGETQEHSLQIDILSDDVIHKLEADLAVDFHKAAREGIIRIRRFSTYSKTHDYGSFSTEDIYPKPRLHESAQWLPVVRKELNETAGLNQAFNLQTAISALIKYLSRGAAPSVAVVQSPAIAKQLRKRVLIFTDSRGQHKPVGSNHKIFAERIAEEPRLEVESRLCPMKWTTTLDFLSGFDEKKLASYDHVILYTGIVDWSPRRISNAVNDIYDNRSPLNLIHNTTSIQRKSSTARRLSSMQYSGPMKWRDILLPPS